MIQIFKYTENNINIDVPFDEDVYINATQIAKGFNKQASKWIENASTIAYIKALAESKKLLSADLVLVRKGGNDKQAQGTWIHPKLAIAFARWLDPKFAVWCDQKIEELLTTGKTTATVEERVEFFDQFEYFYKSLKPGKHWRSEFKNIVSKIETDSISTKYHKEFILACSKHVKTDQRLKLYESLVNCYKDLYEANAIERRTREDMIEYIKDRIIQTQKRRATTNERVSKSRIKAEDTIVNQIQEELDSYKSIIYTLNYPGDYPPIEIHNRKFDSIQDIDDLVNEVNKLNGSTVHFSGFLISNPRRGQKGISGGQYPDYISDYHTFNSVSVGLYENKNNLSCYISKGSIKNSPSFSVILNQITDNKHFGVYSPSVGNRTFVLYNSFTNAMVIFQHVIKSIN